MQMNLDFIILGPQIVQFDQALLKEKQSKERLKFIIYTNIDGTEKCLPLRSGKTKRPQCFNRLHGIDLGFDYDNSKTASINSTTFFN